MHHVAINAIARATLNYNIVDDLAQSPTAMSSLEVLKTCPTQCKVLLSLLGVVDPSDSRLITFDLDQGEPRISSTVAFQFLISIGKLVIQRHIID